SPGHFRVQPPSRHAAEVPRRFMCGAALVCQRRDHSKIDGSNVFLSPAESAPSRKRIAHPPESKRARKVIAAAGRNDQHWQTEFHQLAQVPVNGPVAAEY